MNRSKAISIHRDVAMIIFVAAIFVLAVVYSVFSASTVGTNISTDGTLTVSGAVNASSTLQATGDGLFYDQLSAGASTNTPTTTFNVTGSGYFTVGLGVGAATTSSGGLLVKGQGVFDQTLLIRGSGTSTFSGGISSVGLSSSAGLVSTAGDFLLTGGKIVSTGTGTSTYSGGVSSAGLRSTSGIESTVGDFLLTGGKIVSTGAGTSSFSGALTVTNLGVFTNRLGVNATTSPTVEFGVIGSGYFSGGLGVGYATTSAGNLLVQNLGVFQHRLGVATTSPVLNFEVTGSGYFTGGLGVGTATTSAGGLQITGQGVFAQTLDVRGAGTSTFSGGVSSAGLASSVGLRISAGDSIFAGGINVTGQAVIPVASSTSFSSSNLITVAGVGTSTVSGGLTTGTSSGTFGVGTTSPWSESGVTGDLGLGSGATTTISAESTTAGGCIEIKSGVAGKNTRWVRIYVGGHGATTSDGATLPPSTVLVSGGQGLLVIEEGRCQ